MPGEYARLPLSPAGTLLLRGADLELRAFENLCRHRGAALLDAPCGRVSALVCPYHRWVYDLRGALTSAPHTRSLRGFDPGEHALLARPVRTALGFAFAGPVGGEPKRSLDVQLEGLGAQLEPLLPRRLHLGRRVTYDVAANWKLLAENFLESHHFPAVHPELEALTPTRLAETMPRQGRWLGGTMLPRQGAETVALDGKRSGRPILRKDASDQRVYDYFVWPNMMLSAQPDYLLVYRLYPQSEARTLIIADTYFHPEAASGAHDLAPVLTLWETINRQDHRVCESQQRALGSRSAQPGVYAEVEESMHAFDRWVAEAYLRMR